MLGEAECEVQDLVKANSSIGPMRLELRREGSQVPGYVIIAAYENEASGRKHSALDVHGDYLMPVMDKMVYAKYRVPTRSKESLKVVEELGESLFTFQIPLALLKLFSSLEQKRTADLFDLGELNDHLENVRQDILRSHFLTLGQYQGAMSDIRQQKACFKSSTVKRDRPWEFVATNLHIQRMKVILDSGQPGLAYQCVTFGAPAAHCQGFKQGGLKRMLAELRTSPSYVAGRDSPAVQANEILVKVENIRKSINEMNKQIYTSAANYATGAISSAATQISNKVQTLMQICQTEPVKSAMLGLKSALNRGGSVSEDSPSASQQSDWIWNGADYVQISSTWCLDVTLEQLVAQLALLVQVVDEVSAQIQENVVRPSSSVWHQTSSGLPISTASPRSTRHNSYRRPVASIVSSVLQNATQVDCWTQKLIPVVRRITRTAEGLCQMVTQSLKFYLFELDAGVPGSQLQALKLRKDIVVSQALTALVTAFHSMLSSNVHNKVLYHQLAEVGFLAYFESLLNTQGDEKAMLEDMYVAIQEMCNVSFKLVLAESTDQQLKISGTRTAIVVELPLPRALFEMLPMPLQWGGLIAVVPVLLTQAVIPQQLTDLTSVGSSSLQDDINSEGLAILHQYFADYRQALGGTSAQVSLEIPALADMLGRLNASYQTQKSKNVDFLTKAEQVCRRMNGARLTSCKSAKDRTGMAVTYEMCMILGNEYDLLHGVFQQVLNAIRSRGTRLENCHKNLGVRRYKFTTLQLRCAPKQYCPPEGTYGKAKD
jgi:inositol polyphosphate-4-phosphatase